MILNPTKALVVAVVGAWLAVSGPAAVDAQVRACESRMQPIPDQRLQHSVDGLKATSPGLAFQLDDQPCLHAQETIRALSRTLGRNYLRGISGYEVVKIVNGDGYFTVERFNSRSESDLVGLNAALQHHTPRKLAIEANTSYDAFVSRGSLVLMVSSAVGYDANAMLFRQVREDF